MITAPVMKVLNTFFEYYITSEAETRAIVCCLEIPKITLYKKRIFVFFCGGGPHYIEASPLTGLYMIGTSAMKGLI